VTECAFQQVQKEVVPWSGNQFAEGFILDSQKRRCFAHLMQKEVVPDHREPVNSGMGRSDEKWFPTIGNQFASRNAYKQANITNWPKWFPTGSQLVPGTGLGSGSRSGSRGAPLRGGPHSGSNHVREPYHFLGGNRFGGPPPASPRRST
jgi:hypothetical protein